MQGAFGSRRRSRQGKKAVDKGQIGALTAAVISGIEKLLEPVSAESPCGEDISYDPAYQELEKLLLGKPETQFSPGEPPSWPAIRTASLALLERSRHLRVVITLAAALVRTDGLPGFRDALAVLVGLIEAYWPELYPRLDPEDHNDPTERVNTIATLAMPMGTMGDSFRILEALRTAPLSQPPAGGRFTLEIILAARAGTPLPKVKLPTTGDLEAAFRATPPELLTATVTAAAEALELAKRLDQKLGELVGAQKAPDLAPLVSTLAEMHKALAQYQPAGAVDVAESPATDAETPADEGTAAPARAPKGLSGSVENRQEVTQAIDLVCSYYARSEPSSPVPLLLQRARRLVDLDFLGILADLSPEAVEKAKAATGVAK